MINEIKIIIQNYLDNAKLCKIITGTVETGGIRISEKMLIPNSLIVGNLKNSVEAGDTVRLLRDYGGQLFYILEVIVE
jgi:hypothetical protein